MESSLDIFIVTLSIKYEIAFCGTSLNVTALLNQATKVSNYRQVSKRLYSKCNGEYAQVDLIYFSHKYIEIYNIWLFIYVKCILTMIKYEIIPWFLINPRRNALNKQF